MRAGFGLLRIPGFYIVCTYINGRYFFDTGYLTTDSWGISISGFLRILVDFRTLLTADH